MPFYAQLVIGPAGGGKSTYCTAIQKHCHTVGRTVRIINLDPAAEHFDYEPALDIRELIQVDDAMQDDGLQFGPNGGLVFCMEYFVQNLDWLDETLDPAEDDYYLFDCPGQIELYSHLPVMKRLVEHLEQRDYRLCSVFILDSHFLIEPSNFISGILAALSAMVSLGTPHINVMTKLDLLTKAQKKELDRYLEPDMRELLEESMALPNGKYNKLTKSLAGLVENFSLVKFIGLDISDEESPVDLLLQIDMTLQYGEDLEPSNKDYDLIDQIREGNGDDD